MQTSQTGNIIALVGFIAPIISRGLGFTVTSDSLMAIVSATVILYGIIHQFVVTHRVNKAVVASKAAQTV